MSFYSGDWGHEFDTQIWRAVRIIKLLTQNNIKCNLWIYAKFKRQTGSSSTEQPAQITPDTACASPITLTCIRFLRQHIFRCIQFVSCS